MQKTIVTHNGSFHSDEIFAVATLILAHPEEDFLVVRSRDKEVINKADIVVDVGGVYDPKSLKFDHHQKEGAGIRSNSIPYASFGLVWKAFGQKISGDVDIFQRIDERLVSYIDSVDNGISIFSTLFDGVYPYTIVDFLSSFKKHGASDKENDETFIKLVEVAKNILIREIENEKIFESLKNKIIDIYEESAEKGIIILPEGYPWKDFLVSRPEPVFVIYPSSQDENGEPKSWSVQGVPKEKKSFEVRKPFPKGWAGLTENELSVVSGVSDAIFCHRNLFLAVAKSKDGAMELARKALSY